MKTDLKRHTSDSNALKYGAIVLIVIMLFALLFIYNTPTGANKTVYGCLAVSGYICQNVVLRTNGTISFTLGQNTGDALYNIQLACADTYNAAGLPTPLSAFEWLDNGNMVNISASGFTGNGTLRNGQTVNVRNLLCYGTNWTVATLQSIGPTYGGYIWMNYTTNPGIPNSASWQTVKVAYVEVNFT